MVHLPECALTETMGYVASALVLTTFCFGNPVWLRSFALLSNIAFAIFGYLGAIHPIMVLHLILMPINAFHLARLISPGFRIRSFAARWARRSGQSTVQSLFA